MQNKMLIHINWLGFSSRLMAVNNEVLMRTFGLGLNSSLGARGGVVVKALRYKPAGRGFDS